MALQKIKELENKFNASQEKLNGATENIVILRDDVGKPGELAQQIFVLRAQLRQIEDHMGETTAKVLDDKSKFHASQIASDKNLHVFVGGFPSHWDDMTLARRLRATCGLPEGHIVEIGERMKNGGCAFFRTKDELSVQRALDSHGKTPAGSKWPLKIEPRSSFPRPSATTMDQRAEIPQQPSLLCAHKAKQQEIEMDRATVAVANLLRESSANYSFQH